MYVCIYVNHKVLTSFTSIFYVCMYVGDSRAVLSRAGSAIALSEDHKPLQDRELERIHKAGGFVTEQGRVNGNLNLSRSIGRLVGR